MKLEIASVCWQIRSCYAVMTMYVFICSVKETVRTPVYQVAGFTFYSPKC